MTSVQKYVQYTSTSHLSFICLDLFYYNDWNYYYMCGSNSNLTLAKLSQVKPDSTRPLRIIIYNNVELLLHLYSAQCWAGMWINTHELISKCISWLLLLLRSHIYDCYFGPYHFTSRYSNNRNNNYFNNSRNLMIIVYIIIYTTIINVLYHCVSAVELLCVVSSTS